MLNVDIVMESNEKIEVKTWLPKKSKADDEYYIYAPEDIKKIIDKKIKEKYKNIESYEYLTEVLKIKNKMSAHRHEHNIIIKLNRKKSKLGKQTTNNKKPKKSQS